MDVQKVSNEVRMRKWMTIIDECVKSELPVRTWCNQNNISEQSYYYWLKKIRTQAVQEITSSQVSFSPIPIQEVCKPKSSLIISITKGDIHIEVPDTIDHTVLENIVRTLLC
ncbi:MAG: hypothetical protein RR562_10610 [Longicatena sp.]